MAFFFTLLMFVAFFVLNELLKPKPEAAQKPDINFRFPTAVEGRVVPLIWGTVKIDGPNVVWYGDISQQAILSQPQSSFFGLLSTGGGQTIGFKYFVGIQFALCRGPVSSLKKIWIGEEVVFSGTQGAGTISINLPELFGGNELGNGGVVGDFEFFVGDETQIASTYLSTFQQQGGDTPAYRGTVYGVFKHGYIGNSQTIKPWAFEVRRVPNGLGLANNGLVNNADANPANVLYELITNDEWGLNFPPADIDTANFVSVGNTLETEGNGFSFVLDGPVEMLDLLRIVEEQIDGVVFLDRATGKWKIKLARGDYDIDTVPQATDSNVVEVSQFSRGAWEDTTNHVKVGYLDRTKDYFETHALAQDMANVRIQSGENVTTVESYPGVKDKALANNIAWRDLRSLSIPLAKAKLVVDRTFYTVNPGEVIAWTNAERGFVKLPMRITKVDLGELQEGRITLDLVQDVFKFAQPSFNPPQDTGWVPPIDDLDPFPSAQQLAFEAPYAFVARDPVSPGQRARAWCSGRNQGDGAVLYDIRKRNAPGAPSGSFTAGGTVTAFMLIGDLTTGITKSPSPNPMSSIRINGTPDSKAALQAILVAASAADVGLDLAHLIFIGSGSGGEFLAFLDDTDPGGSDIDLTTVYRGLLDSTPKDHSAGADVFLVFLGGGLTDNSFPETDNVDIKLLPRSATDQVAEGSATTISFTMARRDKLPYPPSRLTVAGTLYKASQDMDAGGPANLDGRGATIGYNRRDWRTTDEVVGLSTDAASIQPDFPTFNATQYRMRVINDPGGSPVTLFTTTFNAGEATIELRRVKVLRHTAGVLPTTLRLEIETRHDFQSNLDIEALQDLLHDLTTTFSELANDFNMGALDSGVTGAAFTAPETGTYNFTIGSNVLTGGAVVEAQINAGAFTTVISAGNTTGTLAGVISGDTIKVRHTQASGFDETFLEVKTPTLTTNAYAILIGD